MKLPASCRRTAVAGLSLLLGACAHRHGGTRDGGGVIVLDPPTNGQVHFGTLTCNLQPHARAVRGAWRVIKSQPWKASGDSVVLQYGVYPIQCRRVLFLPTPPNTRVAVRAPHVSATIPPVSNK